MDTSREPLKFLQKLKAMHAANTRNFQNIIDRLSNSCFWRDITYFGIDLIWKKNPSIQPTQISMKQIRINDEIEIGKVPSGKISVGLTYLLLNFYHQIFEWTVFLCSTSVIGVNSKNKSKISSSKKRRTHAKVKMENILKTILFPCKAFLKNLENKDSGIIVSI